MPNEIQEILDTIEVLESRLLSNESSLQEEIKTLKERIENIKVEKGDKGDDYVLTEKDKKEIADSIKVPVVEKVVEKVEIIREQPIVNETKVENKETPQSIADKLNTLEKVLDWKVLKEFDSLVNQNDLKSAIKTIENQVRYLIQANNSMGGGGGSGTVTSVGLTMPSAFTLVGSPITGAGAFNVTGAGTTSQYIRGDGSLATFPTIPTLTSQLTNDSGFITSAALSPYALITSLGAVAFSNNYNDLSNLPTIPTLTSQLSNDSGFITGVAWGAITGTLSSQTDLQSALNAKQDTLVSGTNIKTINGASVLGSGNLVVSGAPVAGTVILIDANETDTTGTTTNATAKTYSLASNTYSRIIIEAEVSLRTQANTNSDVTFALLEGATPRRTLLLEGDATGAGDQFSMGGVLKWSGAITAGATITISATVNAGAGTWNVNSLRVYGII